MSEPEENPNRIDDEHRAGIGEYLAENVTSGDLNGMLEFMFENWLIVIDRAQMVRGAKRRRLAALKRQRQHQDDGRPDLDDEITQLENEVGNDGGR